VDDDTRRVRGTAFSAVADVYERTRPGYPDEAVDWLVGTDPLRVLELGAGTGKLTRSLLARGHAVVATDPSGPMLDELDRSLGGTAPGGAALEVTAGAAEQLPFAAQSFDAVVAAQSFHWFDATRALPEIARVLRPEGRLALVWNLRDESVPWVRRLSRLLPPGSQPESDSVGAVEASSLFGDVDRSTHRFWQQLDLDGLLGLVQSRSSVALLGGDERRELMRRVEELYAEYGRHRQGMRLPYLTTCFRTSALRSAATPPPTPPGGTDDDDLLFDFR
jgi:SAM-dependent methyltransferase